jgi:hydroxymethylglutaryl-CoA lyase
MWRSSASWSTKRARSGRSHHAVRTLGFPYSISPTFLRKNQRRQTLEDAIEELEKIRRKPTKPDSTPSFTSRWPSAILMATPGTSTKCVEAVALTRSRQEIRTISLADTVGLAPPEKIHEVVSAVMAKYDYLEIGVHLHSRPEQADAKSRPPTTPAAAASIPPSAALEDAPSRRMTWLGTFRPKP